MDVFSDRVWRILRFLMLFLIACSSQSEAQTSGVSTLARLSFIVPPERVDEFEAMYGEKLTPFVNTFGLVESLQQGRVTPDSVFSRLFEFDSPSRVAQTLDAMRKSTELRNTLRQLGTVFGSTQPDSLIPIHFGIYTASGVSGKVIPVGLGRAVDAHGGTGRWHTYSVMDGLPSGSVSSICQDKDGYIWFGTRAGVSRYDGQVFETFTGVEGLADNAVSAIELDRTGNLWFGTSSRTGTASGTEGKGVSRYDGEEWKTFTTADGLADNSVADILQDRNGNLWFGTSNGASRYDGREWKTFTTADGLASNQVFSLLEDRDGNLWFSTPGGVSRYNGKEWKVFTAPEGRERAPVISMFQDHKGNLWFSTWGTGVSCYDGKEWKTFTTADGLVRDEVLFVYQDRDENFWFCTPGGVSRYDGKKWKTFTTEDGLAHNFATGIFEDREGNLWFGTSGGGVSRYEPRVFTVFTKENGLTDNSVRSMLEDREGNLWFGTEGGVSRYDGEKLTTFTEKDGLPSGFVMSIFEDREGSLWFGTGGEKDVGGVARFDGKSWTVYDTSNGLVGNSVLAIFQDREGVFWFGTSGNGISRFDGREWRTYSTADGLPSNNVRSIYQDREGDLWFGSTGGVGRFDGRKFFNQDTPVAFQGNQVRSIFQDREGDLWFASFGGGMGRFDGQDWKVYNTEDGLAHNEVYWGLQDQKGQYWFGLWQAGVSRFDGQVFQTLMKQDGLSDNGVRVVLQDREGDFWFGTHNGITRYRPPAPSPPRVSITAVVANRRFNRRFENVSAFSISSAVGLTTFEFRGMSFKTRPGGMVFRYRLKGYDDTWRITRKQRVEYEDLPVGGYTFEVEAVDRDLVYSEAPARMALNVHLPYERIGLWAALCVAVGLIALQATRLIQRGRRLEESNGAISDANRKLFQTNVELQDTLKELKTAQVQMVHSEKMAGLGRLVAGVAHELNNPIGFIYANMDHLRRYVGELRELCHGVSPEVVARREKVFETLGRLIASCAGGADRIKRIVLGLRTFSRLDEADRKVVDIHEGIDTTLALLEHQFKDRIQIKKEYADLPPVECYAGQLNQVFMNLLTNASDAIEEEGEIFIRTHLEEDRVRIEFQDTGSGIRPQDLEHIFEPFFTTKDVGEGTGLGLSISYGIVQEHGGEILVDSAVGKGTTFTLVIPMRLEETAGVSRSANGKRNDT
ncbi:MAG: ATP-binding protein [bacterium]|nr:ATP-binding protein [bacterium]